MAKIERNIQRIFANQAGSREITGFGTAKTETPVYTTDLNLIQNTNFLNGWQSALLPDKSPWQEDMNALFYAITTQLAYLFQEGIPEYDADTTYYIGSLCKVISNQGNITVYKSKTNDNTGNTPTEGANWSVYSSDSALGGATYEIGLPQLTFSNTLLSNEIWLEGAEVSRTQYANLFNIYGTTYGAGDGSTTFKLPDCRNRVLWGSTSFGYLSATFPKGIMSNTGWSITGGNPGVVPQGTLVAGSGRGEIKETLESLSPTNATQQIAFSGNFNPAAIKCRVKTRYV
nr:MAG TPA: Baseplate structural protein [Caudoviricetes sp.]